MFRRKEDSLFDNTTDPNQAPGEAAQATSQTSTASSASTEKPASSASSSSTQPATPTRNTGYSTPPAAPGQGRSAPVGASQASSFRPGAPTPGDLSRSRMPEAKSPLGNPSTSSAPEKNKGGRRVLTVGSDILLKGEIATCDRLVIEGKVDATLNDVHTVEIAETGSFKGNAHIEDAEISGLFEGELIVRNRLVIYANGKVRGKISYGEIEIERGGEMTGEIKTTSGQPTSRTNTPARKDDKVAA